MNEKRQRYRQTKSKLVKGREGRTEGQIFTF
jgi:hypothetical protein